MLQPGHRIGNYEVVRTIGVGGQGVVYLARHVTLDRLDAVKVLIPAGDREAQLRFEREAVGAARLHHPHIAGVHDAGRTPDGSCYVAMQYVDGPGLDRLIGAGGLSLERTIRIVSGLADALDAAHAHGLYHRDVKPANVIVGRAGTATEHPYLVDFGIAKLVGDNARTAAGQVMGTYAYIAPERIEGRAGDSRSDQYSLACTAYHCLTGTVPFPAASGGAIKAHLVSPPPAVTSRRADLPPAVDTVLARGMAKDPAARYPSCTAFATALREAAAGPPRLRSTTMTRPINPVPATAPAAPFVPPRAAALRPWDTGRDPYTWLGLLVATAVGLAASIPVQRILAGRTRVPLDLKVQFTALMLLALVCGGLGIWLLMRRSPGAWFMLILSTLAAPALRLTLSWAGTTNAGSLPTALQWVAYQPLESGYSAFTVHKGALSLSQHGVLLVGLSAATALVCAYGWWTWSTGAAHVRRTPRREWPWLGGATVAVVLASFAFGDLPADVGVLIALALALNLAALYALARKYLEGWLLFLAAQVCHLSYAVTVSDAHPRPPSMRTLGLVDADVPISPSMALYYVAALLMGAVGLLTWVVDMRRHDPGALFARRQRPAVPPR